MSRTLAVIDFETRSDDPRGGLCLWHESAEAYSCAFEWVENKTIQTEFLEGEDLIRQFLMDNRDRFDLIAHNLQFEYMVLKCRFPEFPDERLKYDTMRMVQLADGGGEEYDFFKKKRSGLSETLARLEEKEVKNTHGVSLEKSARRWLNEEFQDHKAPAHAWIQANVPGARRGKEGSYLHLLPQDLLRQYNVADVHVTFLLFRRLVKYFREIGYDWKPDHKLHNFAARLFADSEIRGVPVDREALFEVATERQERLDEVLGLFREQHKEHIEPMELEQGSTFNLRSVKQMEELFVNRLKLPVKYRNPVTEKAKQRWAEMDPEERPPAPEGSPAFGKNFLSQFGDAAKHLRKKGTYQTHLKQALGAYWLSEYDGRVHFGVRSVGTRSDRGAAGAGGGG